MRKKAVLFLNDCVIEHDARKYLLVDLGAASGRLGTAEDPNGPTAYWPSVAEPSGNRGGTVPCDRYGPIDVQLPPGEPFLLEDIHPARELGRKTVRQRRAKR